MCVCLPPCRRTAPFDGSRALHCTRLRRTLSLEQSAQLHGAAWASRGRVPPLCISRMRVVAGAALQRSAGLGSFLHHNPHRQNSLAAPHPASRQPHQAARQPAPRASRLRLAPRRVRRRCKAAAATPSIRRAVCSPARAGALVVRIHGAGRAHAGYAGVRDVPGESRPDTNARVRPGAGGRRRRRDGACAISLPGLPHVRSAISLPT